MLRFTRRAAVAAAVAVALAAPAHAQENWKVASAAQPGSALLTELERTVANLNKGLGGKIVFERQFVASEQEIAQQLARGRLQMGSVSYAGMSILIPEAAVVTTPYLWVSNAERDHVLDKVVLPAIGRIFAEKGITVIAQSEVGYNGVVCKQPCPTPASVKGMKVRLAPNPSSRTFWTQLGANGVQLPLSELFPALEQNLVVGADLPFSYYTTTPAATSAPHYYDTRHLHHPALVMVNKALFDRQTPDVQAALRAAPVPVAEMRRALDAEIKQKITEFRAKGGKFIELTEAQRNEWRKIVEPAQMDLIRGMSGKSSELFDLIQRAKAEFAAARRS